MLNIVTHIDEGVITQLQAVYSESMNDLKVNFSNDLEMHTAYATFLKDFIKNPKQIILVEEVNGVWVSALRAIETIETHWFLEAVETKPEERRKGYGKELLQHAIDYLKRNGMKELSCTISKNNFKSQALHRKCGFLPTNEPPVNCWGELEEGAVLFRLEG